MLTMRSSCLVAAAVAALAATTALAGNAPQIVADNDQIAVRANDLLLDLNVKWPADQDGTGKDDDNGNGNDDDDDRASAVSMKDVLAEVTKLRTDLTATQAALKDAQDELVAIKGNAGDGVSFDAYPTQDIMLAAVDAAVEGLNKKVLDAQEVAGTAMTKRVDGVAGGIVGLPELEKTVDRLAADMNYVLEHTDNVTSCAADGGMHLGSGECVAAVPTCEDPGTISGGEATLSSTYIIPGVTARYTCTDKGSFLLGPEVRTCSEATKAFTSKAPSCPQCKVDNCEQCGGAADKCKHCAFGHDANDDKSACEARKSTIIIIGGRPPNNGGHNFAEIEALEPNADRWRNFLPRLPGQGTYGAAGMIEGVLYVVTATIRYAPTAKFFRLKPKASSWEAFPAMKGGAADKNKPGAFHGTTNTNFYVFGTVTSQVFSPRDDAWTELTGMPSPRSYGATAVVSKLNQGKREYTFYCLGGEGAKGVTDAVSVFDAQTNKWSQGTPLTSKRKGLAATGYNGKVVVIGGTDGTLFSTAVEIFDPATNQWSAKTAMAHAWSTFTSGPMPVLGSKVILPSSWYNADQGGSGKYVGQLEYDVDNDKWSTGPRLVRHRGQYTIVAGTRD